jgi:hypothetical protein
MYAATATTGTWVENTTAKQAVEKEAVIVPYAEG